MHDSTKIAICITHIASLTNTTEHIRAQIEHTAEYIKHRYHDGRYERRSARVQHIRELDGTEGHVQPQSSSTKATVWVSGEVEVEDGKDDFAAEEVEGKEEFEPLSGGIEGGSVRSITIRHQLTARTERRAAE